MLAKYYSGLKKSVIAKELCIVVNTIRRWFLKYSDHVKNKEFITIDDFNEKIKDKEIANH